MGKEQNNGNDFLMPELAALGFHSLILFLFLGKVGKGQVGSQDNHLTKQDVAATTPTWAQPSHRSLLSAWDLQSILLVLLP